MKRSNETIGFVGFGAMGQFMAEKMFSGHEVVAYDPNLTEQEVNTVPIVELSRVALQDIVVFATPINKILRHMSVALLEEIEEQREDQPLIIEIGSVKEMPELWFRSFGEYTDVLLCHPLFGPQSARDGVEGHKLIVTDSWGEKAQTLLDAWKGLGLDVIEMSSVEHDHRMAEIQAVPFILGRIASSLKLSDDVNLDTPSRQAVRQLEQLDHLQSEALFRSIIECNPSVGPILDQMAEAIKAIKAGYDQNTISKLMDKDRGLLGLTKEDEKTRR